MEMKAKEWKLIDKYGEITYKTGTKYEVADYALRNQLLIMTGLETGVKS